MRLGELTQEHPKTPRAFSGTPPSTGQQDVYTKVKPEYYSGKEKKEGPSGEGARRARQAVQPKGKPLKQAYRASKGL